MLTGPSIGFCDEFPGPAVLKRWLIVLLIALAVILLLSPGIVGRLAEKNFDENLSWVEDGNADIVIEAERFDRGWFSSEGRHRIALRDSAFTDLLGTGPGSLGSEPVALIIETHLDHGLLPITSLGREQGSLQPGLASTVSTLQVERGDGEIVELPGKIYSYIGLTGDSRFHYRMEAGSQIAGNARTDWSGADLTVITSARNRVLSIDGTIQPVSVESYGITTRIGEVGINARQDRSRYTFGVGMLELDVDSVSVQSSGTLDGGFDKLLLNARSELDGDRVNGSTSISLKNVIVPDLGSADLSADITVDDLDAAALEAVVVALREFDAAGGMDPPADLDTVYPDIEPELRAFAAGGGRLEISDLSVSLPQGDWRTSLRIEWPETDSDDTFSWPSMLLKTNARADVSVSAPLYEFLVESIPEAGSLLALGLLKRSGDDYEMEAVYDAGLLRVNGAPINVPLFDADGVVQ